MKIYITEPCVIRHLDGKLSFVGPEGHPANVACVMANVACLANRLPSPSVLEVLEPFAVLDESEIENELVAF